MSLSPLLLLLLLGAGCVGDITGHPGGGDSDPTSSPDTTQPPDDGTDGDDGSLDEPCTDCSNDLFVDLPDTGTVPFELHAGPATPIGTPVTVAFGVPFPQDTVGSADRVVIATADGAEIASHVEELVRWRPLLEPGADGSLRAALAFVEVTFESNAPVALQVHYGVERTRELGPQGEARDTFISVTDDDYSVAIDEPAAYATFSPDWLGATLLSTRAAPVGESGWGWMDTSLLGFASTAVNEVDPQVTELVDYENEAAPWLFDRAGALFNVYARTGDVTWLRHAHRAAQYYASHVDADGYFDFKSWQDMKYSYGQSLVIDMTLTGDRSLVAPIERVASAGATWNETYELTANFWTERHQTYALLAALSAFEATGKAVHAERARAVAEASFDHAASSVEGCLPHTLRAHEGADSDVMVCSPWMSALLSDAVFRYYQLSRDGRALELIASLGDYVADHGMYDGSADGLEYILPWYLAADGYQFSDSGPWADQEHACDVAGLLARGAWAREALGEDPDRLIAATDDLLVTCEYALDVWYRPESVDLGLAAWRLSPPRKFNWWFGTLADLPWLLQTARN